MQLNIGDVLYTKALGSPIKYVINKVTAKRAYVIRESDGWKLFEFDREQGDSSFITNKSQGSRWHKKYFQRETPELAEQYRKVVLVHRLEKTPWKDIPLAQLEAIDTTIRNALAEKENENEADQ